MTSTRRTAGAALAAALAALLLGACAATRSLPARHPEEVTERPLCSDCHEEWQKAYDHTEAFVAGHGAAAAGTRELCASCHPQAFCADCHGYREEISPAEKEAGDPGALLPHPRNYLVRHRVDGRLDPASCFRCHGRRNDARCTPCHR